MQGSSVRTRLREIAHGRSGDKGSSSNIGVIAYTADGFEYLRKELTPERVSLYFRTLRPIRVERYELPRLLAFNFVLSGVLAEGGSRSLRVDAQGKALGVALLEMEIEVPAELLARCTRNTKEGTL